MLHDLIGRPIIPLEGMGSLRDCCSVGSMGCCDTLSLVRANMGLGAADASLTQQVQDTLKTMGASSVSADQSSVGYIYDVLVGNKYQELDRDLADYKRKVQYLNEALRKIDARRDDMDLRQRLLTQHAKVASTAGEYGKALIMSINKYNELVDFIPQVPGIGSFAVPQKVAVTGIEKLDVPTLSGLGNLGVGWAAVAVVAIIAMILWKGGSVIQDAMLWDLRKNGIKEGLDREYDGFFGEIQRYIDKAGGSVLTTALLIGGGLLAFLFVRHYLTKKGVIGGGSAAAPAVPKIEAPKAEAPKPAETAKAAVKEVESIAQGA